MFIKTPPYGLFPGLTGSKPFPKERARSSLLYHRRQKNVNKATESSLKGQNLNIKIQMANDNAQ
jgi:hypothetical protein